MNSLRILSFLITASLISNHAFAQNCFFSETFNSANLPAGWNIGPQVLQLGAQGDTLGTSVDAWRIGDADAANANGYFPLVDFPPGNLSIMANDDAAPCNCDFNNIALASPSLDLSTRTGTALSFRIFHEGLYGVGNPDLEVSTNGGSAWNALETLLPLAGAWQDRFIDLSAFDGTPDLRFRITWSDSLNWASGIALDDFCVYERSANDVTLNNIHHALIAADAFDPARRTLEYSTIPLTQVDTLFLGAEVMNNGTQALSSVQVNFSVSDVLGSVGNFLSPLVPSLAPGEKTTVFVNTQFVPNVSGPIQIVANVTHSVIDDDPLDDQASHSFDVTEPGPLYGHSTMGIAGNTPDFSLDSDSSSIGIGVLLETYGNGDQVYGIGVLLDAATMPGTKIQAFLFDGSFQVLDTSVSQVIDISHITESGLGNYMYLPFDSSYTITQNRDLICMILPEQNDSNFLSISTSGTTPLGSSLMFDASNSSWTFPILTPMIRAYFSDPLSVSISETPDIQIENNITAFPNPAVGHVYFSWRGAHSDGFQWQVIDQRGSFISSGRDAGPFHLNIEGWNSGIYTLIAYSNERKAHVRFQVIEP